ncbi:hypothetical protein NB725_004392 [Pantoea ananatis]|nr:hypothetical protein [Pantoea ananatis]MCW0341696.1 hypothetical protein [Pantoea ananatis]MCW0360155.1 hypothetical protein [Pantoea ananatis]MCW0364782.1 hypothetical protein [Pantoea ananatis]
MRSVRYTLRDAERWASFSGDHNPIHFDAAEARRLGMDGLCVHGMRVLLDMKSVLSQALEKHTLLSGGLLFSSRLRDPVLCNIPYQLSSSETHRGERVQVSGKLVNTYTMQNSINGKLSEANPLALSPVTHVNTLRGDVLAALYHQFRAVEPGPVPLWSFFDAVLFRQLVNATETLETAQGLIPGLKATCLGEVFSQVQVVQTHHQTHFSPGLFQTAGNALQGDAIHYAIQPTLVTGEKTAGLVLVTAIQAWRINEPLMAVTVTLKTGPLVK